MAKKQFKTESRRILELMINSIYTHKEIFLRELVSNASDAIDKLYFNTLEEGSGLSRGDFEIVITADKDARRLTISDNGCGMSREELESNLGTIARSGTLEFKKENADKLDDVEVIGQFGVGFYAAFMVAKKLTVVSRAYGAEEANRWESDGADGYTIAAANSEREGHGTDVILDLMDDTEDENYSEFLDQYRISELVSKYSDYIRYPIKTMKEKRRPKEGAENEYESYFELDTLNSMTPIWKRQKSEVADTEYQSFYADKFFDYNPPARVIHASAEGLVSYTALLFIPEKAPFNFFTREYKRGLQLYSNGVMIMESCEDLLPDYFSFVRGLVDSPDVSLNISREMLQQSRQIGTIMKGIERRVKSELLKMQQEDREKYDAFYKEFGLPIKYGMYSGYGANKDNLKDLVMFHSLKEKKLVTFAEYVADMAEGQQHIYYACGESTEKIAALPQLELISDKGYDVLCMTDDVDEFVVRVLENYGEKTFKSATADDLGLASDEDKEQIKQQNDEHKDMLDFMKDALGIAAVKLSARLKSHPVCLSAEGELSLEMERVLAAMPGSEGVKAQRVLEINPAHPVFGTLEGLFESDKEKLKTYSSLLYGQALLIEGMEIPDPVAFSYEICALMTNAENS